MEKDNYKNREGVQVKGQMFVVDEWYFGPKKKEDTSYVKNNSNCDNINYSNYDNYGNGYNPY